MVKRENLKDPQTQSVPVPDEAKLKEALDRLYPEIRKLAGRFMKRERDGHTLQRPGLANETIIKLLGSGVSNTEKPEQVLALAARQMRNILVDYGRARMAGKRGGGAKQVEFSGQEKQMELDLAGVVSLNTALEELGQINERALRIVELKYFVGFTTAETAQILGVSDGTVENVWHSARIWLHSRLTDNINRAF
jgi:RNA polymerase sigma factor (TIGR02999 family)